MGQEAPTRVELSASHDFVTEGTVYGLLVRISRRSQASTYEAG